MRACVLTSHPDARTDRTSQRSKYTHSHMMDAVNQGSVGEKKSFRVRVCETPALPEFGGEVGVGLGLWVSVVRSLSLAGTLRLGCRGAEVLPAEGGEEHGGRQVHG